MPRGPRLDAPGVVHHITLRGVGQRDLFLDDLDRENFCGRLDDLVPELGFCCLASALMPNHVHMIVRSGEISVSRLMASLCTGYALYFAKRHGWVGHVFQNRFASSRIGDDAYLTAAIAYVHRNPVEAGLVSLEELASHPWTSHSAAVGLRAPRRFESIQETLAPFQGDPLRLAAAVARATAVPGELQWRKLPRARAPLCAARAPASTFEALVAEVCGSRGLTTARLLSRERSRVVSDARLRVAVRATRELAIPHAEVARRLRVSSAAVSQMLARSRRRA